MVEGSSVPDFESRVELVYRTLLEPGAWAIDAGAHSGRHTIPLAWAAGPEGRVIAFEPLPTARAWLEQRLLVESRQGAPLASVEVRSEALGRTDGPARFVVVDEFPEYSGLRERAYHTAVKTREIEVACCRLDSLLPLFRRRIEFLKIDAEGGETHILEGALALLQRDRPIVCFEFGDNSNRQYEVTAADLFALWEGASYRIYTIRGDLLDREGFSTSASVQALWDYVAIPLEAIEGRGRRVVEALRALG